MLLFYVKAPFFKAVGQSVFVHFFQMAMTQKAVNIEACFANNVTKAVYIHGFDSFRHEVERVQKSLNLTIEKLKQA